MTLVPTMILGPLAAGVGVLCLRPEGWRRLLVVMATVAMAAGAFILAAGLPWAPPAGALPFHHHLIDRLMLAAEVVMALYIMGVGWRRRSPLVMGLMLAQAVIVLTFEATQGHRLSPVSNLYVDKFTIVMALINGVIGGGICLYALSYMREYHEVSHKEYVDRRPLFFGNLLVFMGAMFGIIFSNNLLWLYFFWEVTTLASFLLIGYTKTEVARNNALRALKMNLAGGLAFVLGIVWLHRQTGSIELQTLLAQDKSLVLLPAALFCFAGLTKSAQFPFCGWLLGAMVAPTPVSALLHSSTMVKAGVYLVLRLAPVLAGTGTGLMVALIGAVTFVGGSFAAISTSDAKRVLAWSTVANLGLIVLCGGIGTYEAVWAGVLLIIFHAVAKCLLFLSVGVVEHKLHSRDIETMSGLILNMPRVAIVMLIGMAGMFLAPFGMLISKWAVLKAVVDAYPALSVFIAFGSAATLFFWVKWMGKLLEVTRPPQPVIREMSAGEAGVLYGLAIASFVTCLGFPFVSSEFIEPYVTSIYGQCASMSHGNVIIMMIMMAMVMLFPLSFALHGRSAKVMHAYLGGANVQSGSRYRSTAGEVRQVSLNNYYLGDWFEETRLRRTGEGAGLLLLALMVFLACL